MFEKVSEAQITRAIADEFYNTLREYSSCDVVVVGSGPSGLMAARELAKDGIKTLIIEANNFLGGGFWIGGYLMNIVTFRAPSHKVLDELRISHKEVETGLYTSTGPEACSKLIAATCDAGVRILNMTRFEDVIYKDKRVCGTVINWTAVGSLPRALTCLDPVSIESRVVIDASGHDAVVAMSLERRGILKTKGYGAMDVNTSEDLVVEHTKEIIPGLVVTGMAVSTVFGIPRMGPTFGAMLLSGKKAAEIVKKEMLVKA